MFGLPVHSTRHQSPRARPSWTRTAGFVGAAMLLAVIGSAQEKAAAPASPPAENKPAEFVGSTTCQMCHEDIFNAFQKNPHQLVETDKKRGWDTKACESCHGPGSKHAESASAADIRQPAKLNPGEADRICLACHRNQSTHSGRINSGHARNQVSCTACHSIHKNGPYGLVARKPVAINALCAGCHTDIWASFQKPYKHACRKGRCPAWIAIIRTAARCPNRFRPHNPTNQAAPNATATKWDHFPSSTLRCASKDAGRATNL